MITGKSNQLSVALLMVSRLSDLEFTCAARPVYRRALHSLLRKHLPHRNKRGVIFRAFEIVTTSTTAGGGNAAKAKVVIKDEKQLDFATSPVFNLKVAAVSKGIVASTGQPKHSDPELEFSVELLEVEAAPYLDVDELDYEITDVLKDSEKTSTTCENAGNIDVLAEFDIAKPDSLDTQLLGCSIAEGDGSVIACSNIEGGLVDADCAKDGKNCQCILVIGDKPSLTSKATRLHSVKLQLSYNDVVQDSKDIKMSWDATVPTSEEPSDETTSPESGNEEETTASTSGTTPTSTATTTTEKPTPPKPTLPIVIPGGDLRNGGEETAASEEKAEENRSSSTKDNTGLIVGLVFLFLICIIIIIVIAVIMWRKKQADELAAAKDAPAAAITNDVYAQPPGAGPLDNPMYGVAGGATGSGYYATNADYAASNGVYAGVGTIANWPFSCAHATALATK